MGEKENQHLFQVQEAGTTVNNGQEDDTERLLQRGQLVELVQDHRGSGFPLQFDDGPQAFTIRLIAQVSDALDPLFVNQLGDTLYEVFE